MRRTSALLAVAGVLMTEPRGLHWGYSTGRAAGLRSGVLYPILSRLLEEGWLADGWEDPAEARRENRPPRRYYRLTDEGIQQLGGLLASSAADERAPVRQLGWSTP